MTTESIRFDAILDMLGGDRQVVAALLTKFSSELVSDVAASEHVLAEQDANALRQIAHRVNRLRRELRLGPSSAGAADFRDRFLFLISPNA